MRLLLLLASLSVSFGCNILFPCGPPQFGAVEAAPRQDPAFRGCATDADCPVGNECRTPEAPTCGTSCRCTPRGMECAESCATFQQCLPRRTDGGVDGGLCATFEPPCSSSAQCGPGRACLRHANECNPSACGCDPQNGAIICTADCGGSRCTVLSDGGTADAGSKDGGP